MTKTNQRILETFLEVQKLSGRLSGHSLKFFTLRFFKYCEEAALELSQVGIREAESYLNYLYERGRKAGGRYARGTLMNFMKAVRRLYDHLKKINLVMVNPFEEMEKVKEERKLPRAVLKENQLHKLLEALQDFDKAQGLHKQKKRYIVHIVCELLYATGMRIKEAAYLTLKDIDFDRGLVRIAFGKGGRMRFCILSEYIKSILSHYITDLMPWLLASPKKNPRLLFGLASDYLCAMINRELKQACLSLDLPVITSHGFRHAFGFHLLRAGCNIRLIQEFLGHKKLATTEIYTRVEKEDLKTMLDAYHPRVFKKAE